MLRGPKYDDPYTGSDDTVDAFRMIDKAIELALALGVEGENGDWRVKLRLFARSVDMLLADPRTPEKTRECIAEAVREIINSDTRGFDTADDLRAMVEKLQPEDLDEKGATDDRKSD